MSILKKKSRLDCGQSFTFGVDAARKALKVFNFSETAKRRQQCSVWSFSECSGLSFELSDLRSYKFLFILNLALVLFLVFQMLFGFEELGNFCYFLDTI